MDFNADLGESFGLWERGADEALMRVISSANVACGFHAGDPGAMRRAVASARANGVHVGAHPGLPDLLGFGRRVMDVAADDVRDYVLYQVAALDGFAHGLHHVKPHGALYMMALDDAAIARAVAEGIAEYQEGLPVYTLAGSELWHAAAAAGLPAVAEFFADRPLNADGTVVMFGWQALFDPTPEAVAARVRSLLETGTVPALDGTPVAVEASTVCVHSDTPRADELGVAVRAVIGAAEQSAEAPMNGGGVSVRDR
jgi:5-oxoprolinase (ATP-hydrolysing) subunit A